MEIRRKKRYMFKPLKEHTVYKNSNDEVVPSATTVLKLLAKNQLIGWANFLGWKRKNVDKELDRASTIGTLTHSYIEKILLNEKFDFSALSLVSYEIEQGVVNSVSSFMQWYKENKDNLEVINTELKMEGEEYGGTADLICKWNGKLAILDFKTSSGFYYSMFLQLAGYAKLYETIYGDKIEDVIILRVDKKKGKMAETMTIDDLNEISKFDDISNRGLIEYYMEVYDKLVNLYYDIHDINCDWGTSI